MAHPLDARRQPMSRFAARGRLGGIRNRMLNERANLMHYAASWGVKPEDAAKSLQVSAIDLDLDALDTCERALEEAENAASANRSAYARGYESGERSGASRVTNAQRGQDMGG